MKITFANVFFKIIVEDDSSQECRKMFNELYKKKEKSLEWNYMNVASPGVTEEILGEMEKALTKSAGECGCESKGDAITEASKINPDARLYG